MFVDLGEAEVIGWRARWLELPKKVGEVNNCKCTIMNQQVTKCSHAEKKGKMTGENY